MQETGEKIAHKLFDAIEQVREDVARVEFWASAITGFSQPVPEYDPRKMKVWLPGEQAKAVVRKSFGH